MSRNKGFTLIELMIVVAIIAIIAAIAIPSLLKSRIAANETSAAGTLKQLVTCESTWRQNDTDRNAFQDYWTGDVSGFYRVLDGSGVVVKVMDIAVAKSDLDPKAAIAFVALVKGPHIGASVSAAPAAKSGYLVQAMTTDESAVAYQAVPDYDGDGLPYNSTSDFAFQASPDKYNSSGINIFIVNGEGVIWKRDNGNNLVVLTWPGSDPSAVAAPWSKVE